MKKYALIVDLDYTIFHTSTIDRKVLSPFFEHLLDNINTLFPAAKIEAIVADLWKDSWDVVVDRYKIPKTVFAKSVSVLESFPLELTIETYSDYHFLKNYPADKFLVTTGLTSLQKAKIKALNIENDFKEIIINDRLIETRTKVDIFHELITKHNLDKQKTYVIGDNPDSEIHAGNLLNLKTIQIVRGTIVNNSIAMHCINSFEKLNEILMR